MKVSSLYDLFMFLETCRLHETLLGMMGWAGQVTRKGQMRNEYKLTVGKPIGKTPIGRPRRRWDIKMDLREREWEGVDRWRALVNTVMNS
jgi:hypothetical protein